MNDEPRDRLPIARLCRVVGEAVLLALATLSAWPFAAVTAFWECALTVAVAVLAVAWAAHSALTRRFRFRPDAVSVGLAGLALLSAAQLVPLPLAVVRVVSPARAELHTALTPDRLEQLPGEPDPPGRAALIPLATDPFAARVFAARVLAVFVVYAAARNWLAGRAAFRRLAWAMVGNGVLLAAFALSRFLAPVPSDTLWGLEVGTSAYGPFVNRNHFPDFLALCVGLGLGLMLTKTDREREAEKKKQKATVGPGSVWEQVTDLIAAPIQLLERPVAVAAALAVGLMLTSIPFSLSRGGLLAVVGAAVATWVLGRWQAKAAGGGTIRWAITLAVAVVAAGLMWKGTAPIQKRFSAALTETTADDRTGLWAAGLKQWPGYWLAGSGSGSFARVEPLARGSAEHSFQYEHAHNEFVEAAVEGGAIRLALTAFLAVGLLWTVARGYRRWADRSTGGLLLGAWFGLAVLVLHAVTDFAVHLPAVAAAAAVVGGYAMALAADDEFAPRRRRVGSRRSSAEPTAPEPVEAEDRRGGLAERVTPYLLAAVAVLAAVDARARWRSDEYRVAADRATAPDRRLAHLTERTRVTPGDPVVWFDLAQGHLDAATPADQEHTAAALRALRTARDLCPVYPAVHARLGLYAGHFAKSEPPLVHLERAKRLFPSDPDVWFACGTAALAAGDTPTAEAYWKRSLELSPRLLKGVLKAGAKLTATDLRDRVLPDDPAVLMEAADVLFPDRARQGEHRRPLVSRAAAGERANLTARQFAAVAAATEETSGPDDAEAVWKRATEAHPADFDLGLTAATWYEKQEKYADAVKELDELVRRNPTNADLPGRLQRCKHGLKLQDILGR